MFLYDAIMDQQKACNQSAVELVAFADQVYAYHATCIKTASAIAQKANPQASDSKVMSINAPIIQSYGKTDLIKTTLEAVISDTNLWKVLL